MDAEPIVLPKFCGDRLHFCVRTCDAILRLPGCVGMPAQALTCQRGWVGLKQDDEIEPRQPRRPGMLLLYAHDCGLLGRLAKALKASKTRFLQGPPSTTTAGFSLAKRLQ